MLVPFLFMLICLVGSLWMPFEQPRHFSPNRIKSPIDLALLNHKRSNSWSESRKASFNQNQQSVASRSDSKHDSVSRQHQSSQTFNHNSSAMLNQISNNPVPLPLPTFENHSSNDSSTVPIPVPVDSSHNVHEQKRKESSPISIHANIPTQQKFHTKKSFLLGTKKIQQDEFRSKIQNPTFDPVYRRYHPDVWELLWFVIQNMDMVLCVGVITFDYIFIVWESPDGESNIKLGVDDDSTEIGIKYTYSDTTLDNGKICHIVNNCKLKYPGLSILLNVNGKKQTCDDQQVLPHYDTTTQQEYYQKVPPKCILNGESVSCEHLQSVVKEGLGRFDTKQMNNVVHHELDEKTARFLPVANWKVITFLTNSFAKHEFQLWEGTIQSNQVEFTYRVANDTVQDVFIDVDPDKISIYCNMCSDDTQQRVCNIVTEVKEMYINSKINIQDTNHRYISCSAH